MKIIGDTNIRRIIISLNLKEAKEAYESGGILSFKDPQWRQLKKSIKKVESNA